MESSPKSNLDCTKNNIIQRVTFLDKNCILPQCVSMLFRVLVTQSIFEATDIPPPTSAWFRDSAHCVGHETRALLLKLLRTAAQNSLLRSHLVKCNRWTGNITETIEENQGSVQTKISSVTVREKLQLCQKLKFVNQVRIHWVNSRILVTKSHFPWKLVEKIIWIFPAKNRRIWNEYLWKYYYFTSFLTRKTVRKIKNISISDAFMVIASLFWYPFCKVDIWEISKLNTKNNPTKVKKSVTFWHSRWKIHLLNPLTFAQCLKIPRKVSFYNLTKGYANFGHFGREIQIVGKIWDIFSGFLTTVTLVFPLLFFAHLKPYLSLDDSASPSTDSSRHQQTRQIELMKF